MTSQSSSSFVTMKFTSLVPISGNCDELEEIVV